MKTIRASEIGSFLYCQRAWWYARQGFDSENQGALELGRTLHERHGQKVMLAGCLSYLAYAFLLLALLAAVAYVVLRVM
jgi:hypothetical protein